MRKPYHGSARIAPSVGIQQHHIIIAAPSTSATPISAAKAANVPRIGRIAWNKPGARVWELFIEASLWIGSGAAVTSNDPKQLRRRLRFGCRVNAAESSKNALLLQRVAAMRSKYSRRVSNPYAPVTFSSIAVWASLASARRSGRTADGDRSHARYHPQTCAYAVRLNRFS